MSPRERFSDRDSRRTAKYIVALLVAWVLAGAAGQTLARCQIHAPFTNQNVVTIDGTIDTTEWRDASFSLSGQGCLSAFHDGSKNNPMRKDLKVYAKQDGNNVYLAFDIPDSTSNVSAGAGEKLIVQFDSSQQLQNQLTMASTKLVVTNFRRNGDIYDTSSQGSCMSAPCRGTKAYYKATGSRMCSGNNVPNWIQHSWPTSIEVGIDNNDTSRYRIELKVPKTQIQMGVSPNDILNLALIVVNDLGTTTGNAVDAFAARFPSDLPVAAPSNLLTNPADPTSGCNDWMKPAKWGIAAANLSGDVTINKGDPPWTSPDIAVLGCPNYSDSATYQYQSTPCRFKVKATLHNTGASADYRDVLVVVSPHGTGQTNWQVIDLIPNVQVGVGGSNSASEKTNYARTSGQTTSDGGYRPMADSPGHPCVKVYVLPTSDNGRFPKSRLSNGAALSDGDLQTLMTAYGLSDGLHVAQQNISMTGGTCSGACAMAGLDGPVRAADMGTLDRPAITFASFDFELISGAFAQYTGRADRGIPGNLRESYGRENIILSLAAFAYPTSVPPSGTTYRIIEPIGGVIQLFPTSLIKNNGSLPIKLLVGNTQPVEQAVFLTVQAAHFPPGLEGTQYSLPQDPIVIAPGQTTTIQGQLGKPCQCGDQRCLLNKVFASNERPGLGEFPAGLALFSTLGVGGLAFLRRRKRDTIKPGHTGV
ncbi:MAG: hypothetical protein ACK5YW_09180 [Betaproteobacteria bacterium]|jgi:hypothetical protein|nr:hypothetical protein [Rhodocyclaceae bacterium]MCE2898304.1 hypothetical protein [Betaproteobacteria bacterium]